MTTTDDTRRVFTLHWSLDATPEQAFEAWTDPERLGWYFNDHQPIPDEPIELDLRVGGVWRQKMVIDEETSFFTGGVYREIVPGERLVFAWGATDGWPKVDPANLDDAPQVTVAFSQDGERTEMMLHVEFPIRFSEDEVREWIAMGVENGWRDTVDRLAAALGNAPAPA